MTIAEHLTEARRRLLWALAGILVCAIPAWFIYDVVIDFITQPLQMQVQKINFTTVGAAFDLHFEMAIWIGFLLSSPWWIAQIWIFVAPGILPKEKLVILIFGIVGVILFLVGAGLGAFTAPAAIEFLASFTPANAINYLNANSYVEFYMRLVLVFGISGLFPELMVGLNFLGIVQATTWAKWWRWVVLGAFIFSAIANPMPGPWAMTVQAVILVGLYIVALGICYLREFIIRKRAV